MMMAKSKADPNYFRFPKPLEGTIIAFLMVIFYDDESLWTTLVPTPPVNELDRKADTESRSRCARYSPGSVILDYVGPLGSLARYLNKNQYSLLNVILFCAASAHAGEAVYARTLCKRKGINTATTVKWMIQTFIFGFPSLLQLVAYDPDMGTKNR